MQQKLPLYYVNWEFFCKFFLAMIENASIRVMEKAGMKFEKNSGVTIALTLVVLMCYIKNK